MNTSAVSRPPTPRFRVLHAVLLHDMRTRFGKTHLSYLIAVAWPLTHAAVILLAYVLFHRVAPIGSEPAIFASTGLLPYILCLYPARMMTIAIQQNKPILQFSVIKPVDIIVARTMLEVLNCFVLLIIMFAALKGFSVEFSPTDPYEMCAAIVASIYLGLGFGFSNVVMQSLIGPFYVIFPVLCLVGLYLTSGAFLPIELFPDSAMDLDVYNPLLHCVEWLRAAYYGTESRFLDKFYVIAVPTVLIAAGLAGERLVRGRLMT